MEQFVVETVFMQPSQCMVNAIMARASTGRSRSLTTRSSDYGQRLLGDALAISSSLLRSQKSHGAERLKTFAEATRDYATSLEDIPGIRSYVTMAADSVDALADYVDETELEEMVSDASAFAKRQPLATLLIAVSAGLVATFVVRSQMTSSSLLASTRSTRPARKSRKSAARRKASQKASGKRARKAPARSNSTSVPAANA